MVPPVAYRLRSSASAAPLTNLTVPCHGLLHPDQIGINRPGPKGFVDQPIDIGGLYLASAGCYGGPGITFIPGYNAGRQALEDASAT